MARTLTARLHQTDGPKGIRLFEVFDHRFLRVRQTVGPNTRRDYAMDIAILGPTARTVQYGDRQWLWLAAASAGVLLLSLLVLYLGQATPQLLLPLAGVLLAAAIICINQFLRSRRQRLIFDSRYAAVPLVELLVDQPEPDSYRAFVAGLCADIESLVRGKGLTPTDLRAGELRSLRKLLEQQVIDLPTYEGAKRRLLAQAG
ncbi:MAG: hypothetical protein Kow0096_16170 [Thiohalomonadaceae bacterium]